MSLVSREGAIRVFCHLQLRRQVSEDCNDNGLDDSTPIDAPPSHFNSPITPIASKPSVELRRSTRARRTPRYLEDFVK